MYVRNSQFTQSNALINLEFSHFFSCIRFQRRRITVGIESRRCGICRCHSFELRCIGQTRFAGWFGFLSEWVLQHITLRNQFFRHRNAVLFSNRHVAATAIPFLFLSVFCSLDPLPPGCFTISCAHMRAWEYYAETVYPGNEENFMGIRCTSLTALNTNQCRGNSYPMGYATPHTLKGNYFLSTNSDRPYGRNVREGRKLGCWPTRKSANDHNLIELYFFIENCME